MASAVPQTSGDPETQPTRHRAASLTLGLALTAAFALAAWADLAFGWVEPAFDLVAHLFYEVPMLARVRRPSQLPLARAHLAVFAVLLCGGALAAPWLGRHVRRWWWVFLAGYAVRAVVWVAGGNVPLVPGDSCHYLEVATSVDRGEGPVKHYVESFFLDYPAIREGRGALDDWATPLYAYILAGTYRLFGVEPCRDLEETVGVAKGVSFALSLLALPALYGFGRRRFDRETGLWAMAVLAVLPVHAIYAGFALRESLVALTSVLAVWTLTEVWSSPSRRAAWGWAVVAGLCGGLAILARNTALALLAAAGLFGLLRHGRRVPGPLILWGLIVLAVIAPWAYVTFREYGQPFFSYTNYFQYNFSWAVHHYEKGLTRASDFYTRANAPEIARVKVKSLAIIAVTSTMILSLPLTLAALRRAWRGGDTDRLVAVIAAVFVAATLANIADVTQVAQLGRYYLPVFVIALPTAVAGLRDAGRSLNLAPGAWRWVAVTLVALLWSDPNWAYDAGWLVKPYQLHWPALREAGDWVKAHPEAVPPDARVLTWFPWEFRVASGRTTVLLPRNYSLKRVDEVIRQYGVTHVVWGSFEPPPHVDPETWGPYLDRLRLGIGLTDARELHASPRGLLYPVRIYRLR
jgi:hypothetical protein